jgi:hypothetical protein
MNVRLQYNLEFAGAVHIDGHLQLNQYQVNLDLQTCVRDRAAINIAMDRLKIFMHGELANTVFINQAAKERAEMLQIMGANVTTLPEEPVDQIIGMMLYYKLNAVMEGRLVITQLDVSSVLGDSVWYQHSEDDSAGPFAAEGWWHQANTQHDSIESTVMPDNVVKVTSTGWNEMRLDWPDNSVQSANTVVYANFSRDEN